MSPPPDQQSPSRPDGAGRVPPHNLQAEESLLGAMLLSRDAIAAAVEVVEASHFYKPAHGHIFEAILSLYGAGEPVDPVTVAEELRRAELLEAIGGAGLLVSIQAGTPAIGSASRYARIVEEHALLRRLIAVAHEIAELGYSLPEDVTKAIDTAEARVFDVAQRRVTDTASPLSHLLSTYLDRLEQLYERDERVTGVATGYGDLDDLLAGLQPSNLVVVGARPAMGKCVAWDTPLVDPCPGAGRPAAEVHRTGSAGVGVALLSLDDDPASGEGRLAVTRPSAFVDDGIKPLWRVTTRLGRQVRTTAVHPFLTPRGWRPLRELEVGDRIGVPRRLPVFGNERLPDAELVMLAALLGTPGGASGGRRVACPGPAVTTEVMAAARSLGIEPVAVAAAGTTVIDLAPGGAEPELLTELLLRHRLAAGAPTDRRLPDVVFRLPRHQLARFLNCLLAVGGPPWLSSGGTDEGRVELTLPSGRLAREVQHLLLRFGIAAAVRATAVASDAHAQVAHDVVVAGADNLALLAADVGITGHDPALRRLASRARPSRDLRVGVGAHGRPVQSGLGGGGAGSVEPHRPEEPVLAWDEIVAIEPAGADQVYDLTVPGLHNFVAADLFVHNTSFALGMAAHAAIQDRRPVLFFSLEMSKLELSSRLLSADARVDSTKLRNGRLSHADWDKINHALGRLHVDTFVIDDNANLSVMEIRARARRLKSQVGDLGMVVVDYLQLMTGRNSAENRQVEVSEISRGLKILARELEAPVVALSQLSRGLELRSDKRPVLADLRESGCLTADARVLRADTGAETTMGELLLTGQRDVPVWTVDGDHRLVPGTLSHVFATGTKPVYELALASGRRLQATGNHPFLTPDGWASLDQLALRTPLAIPADIPAPSHRTVAHPADVDAARVGPGLSRRVFALGDDDLARFLAQLWSSQGTVVVSEDGPPSAFCSSTSRRLLDGVQLLLLRFGVLSRLGHDGESRHRRTYWLEVAGDDGVGRLLDVVNRRRLRCPRAATRDPADKVAASAASAGSVRPGLATTAVLDHRPSDVRAQLAWDPVVAIEPVGEEPVFDATVPGTHNFVANGIVVHNSIEQDADVVMFIYRDDVYHPESPDRGTAEILVAKHRSGPTGVVRLSFLDQYTRFVNMAKGF